MMAGFNLGKALPWRLIVTVFIPALLAACPDPEADQRERICKGARLPVDVVKECKRSEEDYKRIMQPIRAQQDKQEIADFAEALAALPVRAIPKDRYQAMSVEQLRKEPLGTFGMIGTSRMATHPLLGKRLKIHGRIGYHPTDFTEQRGESVSIQAEGEEEGEIGSLMVADLESLSRMERAFIKARCMYLLEHCRGDFFGVIGPIQIDPVEQQKLQSVGLESIGLQIEYMEIAPKKLEKERD